MAALTPATRYFQPEVTKVFVLPAVAAADLTPTLSEITGGTDVTGDLADWTGWSVTSNDIVTPDLAHRFNSSIPGRITADASSITWYADLTGVNDIRTVLQRDQNTFLAIMDGGNVIGSLMDVFKVTVSSVGKIRAVEDAPKLTVMFTIRDFAEDLPIPAA